VLMDVNMPFLSGDNLAGLFKRHPVLSKVPIVLFSSNDESILQRMARDVGAIGFISKSEMASGFARKVRLFLSLSEHRRSMPPEHEG